VDVDAAEAAEAAEWLQRIEDEHAGELTPERLAAMEAAAAAAEDDELPSESPIRLDENQSPVAGRRFTRA
jgi:(E)-4-hydroxy-3-methylbut-2-enyl-diphosphate synthase